MQDGFHEDVNTKEHIYLPRTTKSRICKINAFKVIPLLLQWDRTEWEITGYPWHNNGCDIKLLARRFDR